MFLFIGLVVLGIVLTIVGSKQKWYDDGKYSERGEGHWAMLIIGAILLTTMALVTPLHYVDSVGYNAKLQVFYDTHQNYAYAIDETSNILSINPELMEQTLLIPVDGSIEKINVGAAVSDRILEFRNDVARYNQDLVYIRAMDKNPIMGIFYATPNEELKPIVIK